MNTEPPTINNNAHKTADLNENILNLKSSSSFQKQSSDIIEPYKLTFFIDNNNTGININNNKANDLQLTDFTNTQKHVYDNNDVIIESFDDSNFDKTKMTTRYHHHHHDIQHESYCILSALLYLVTITTFAYLLIMWIKQRMYIRMEQMHWW